MDPGLPGNIHRPLVNPGQLDLDQRNIALNKAFSVSKKQLYPRSGAVRNNVPITKSEYLLKDGLSIVSTTDIKGRITYVNPYFVEVSGFSEAELIGAPHNIVRHPDMPPEAFADLWHTLQAGIPWTGMVKNRRKDGDYYWVLANVTPVREGNQTVGYMSVRTKPGRDQVDAAEKIYRKVRQGRAGGIAIRRGSAVNTGVKGWLAQLRNLRLGLRVGLGLSFIAAMHVAVGTAAFTAYAGGMLAWWIAGGTACGVLACLQLYANLDASVVQPIRNATQVARAIAGGDLAAGVGASRNDEIGQLTGALQQMNVNLQAIIGDVRATH
jgi:aerotaxis receptor